MEVVQEVGVVKVAGFEVCKEGRETRLCCEREEESAVFLWGEQVEEGAKEEACCFFFGREAQEGRIQRHEFVVFFDTGDDERCFKAKLPDGEEDVVEELEADAAAEASIGGGADAGAAGPHGAVGVFVGGAGGGAKNGEEWGESGSALMPEELAGFLGAQQRGVFLDGDVLEAGVLGFREGGEIFIEGAEGRVSLGC